MSRETVSDIAGHEWPNWTFPHVIVWDIPGHGGQSQDCLW